VTLATVLGYCEIFTCRPNVNVHILCTGWSAVFAKIERSRWSKQFWYIWRRAIAHFFIWKVCKGVRRLL